MPPRFVEVVDVGAEASSTIAALLASGRSLWGGLSFNVSQYINENTTEELVAALRDYNLTLDAIPTEWDLKINMTVPDEYVPEGRARQYLLAGAGLILARELVIAWRVRRMLRQFGLHK